MENKFSKTSILSDDEISIIIRTSNQSIKNQPCLWLLHGSGGISNNDDIWVNRGLDLGYTVIQVDSYSNRGIFKQKYDSLTEYQISPKKRALDVLDAYYIIAQSKKILPFADIENNIVLGFSDGGAAALWLQTKEYFNIWKMSYCLYPPLNPSYINDDLLSVDKNKVHIFVGELDNWTPASHSENFAKRIGCKISIWPDTHHSFSKPGVDNEWPNVINCSKRDSDGNYLLGVYCQYSPEYTEETMKIVFTQ